MVSYGNDPFTRANTANGTWGTSAEGKSWARPFGSATTYSVSSNKGVIGNTPSTWDHFTYGSNFSITTTLDVLVRVTPDTATSENWGVLLRVSSAGTTGYKVIYEGGTGSGFKLYYDSSGTGLVQIGSTSAFTPVVGSSYWVKGEVDAATTTLKGKIWKDGTTEPTSWTISASIPTANKITSGGIGVVGNANTNLKFDQFSATDGSTAPTVVTGTVSSVNVNSSAIANTQFVTNTAIEQNSSTATITNIRPTLSQDISSVNANAGQANIIQLIQSLALESNDAQTQISQLIQTLAREVNTSAFTAQSVPIQSATGLDAQMLYADLQQQYARIRQTNANKQIAKMGIALFPPARVLSEYAIPGYLAIRLKGQDWTQHTKLKTINDVSNFIYQEKILADTPTAYYRLNETSGTTAHDLVASQDATAVGGVTPGQPGVISGSTAMLLDGSTGYVALPNSINPAGWTAFSCSVWIKLTNNTFTSYPCIIANDFPNTDHDGLQIYLAPSTDGHSIYMSIGNGTTATQVAFGSGVLAAGVWTHLALTYNGATMKAYINGSLIGSSAASAGAIFAAAYPFSAGRYPGDSGWLPGSMNELAIFNYELTATQISSYASQ